MIVDAFSIADDVMPVLHRMLVADGFRLRGDARAFPHRSRRRATVRLVWRRPASEIKPASSVICCVQVPM